MNQGRLRPSENRTIVAKPLTRAAFAPFGDIIEKDGAQNFAINDGNCVRYHDLASVDVTGPAARPLINIFAAQACALPLELKMVERHPLGSQAFMPLSRNPFLVIVCHDTPLGPAPPQAFVTAPGQGINLKRNVWHGVLTPLYEAADFVVVDRGGDGDNLEEHVFAQPFRVDLP